MIRLSLSLIFICNVQLCQMDKQDVQQQSWFLFGRVFELDRSGPRSSCHCLPVSQHCLPGAGVAGMIFCNVLVFFLARIQSHHNEILCFNVLVFMFCQDLVHRNVLVFFLRVTRIICCTFILMSQFSSSDLLMFLPDMKNKYPHRYQLLITWI